MTCATEATGSYVRPACSGWIVASTSPIVSGIAVVVRGSSASRTAVSASSLVMPPTSTPEIDAVGGVRSAV